MCNNRQKTLFPSRRRVPAIAAGIVSSLACASFTAGGFAGAVADGVAGSACNVQTREFTLDFLHAGSTQATVHLDFCPPISMSAASFVALDTLVADVTTTTDFSETYSLTVELMSGGTPIVNLSTMNGSQSGNITTKRNFAPRADQNIPGGMMADGIRLTSSISSTTMSVRYRGAFPNNRIRVHVGSGAFGPGQCHAVRSMPAAPQVTIEGQGTSAWVVQSFGSVSAANLRFVLAQHPGFSIGGATSDSFDIEAQLLLSNGQSLQMSNWSSPGASGPPSGPLVWACVARLTVGHPSCESLAGLSITGWRWRFHKTGAGTLTVTQVDPTRLWFLRRPCVPAGDLNGDGAIDGADLAILLAGWGPCAPGQACPEDLNGDCVVDGADLAVLLSNWGGAAQIPGDLNGDGVVNGADLAIMLSQWGPCADCGNCLADLNNDCIVGGADLAILLSNWG